MNPSQSKNNQQPPEKTNGFFSIFSSKKPQQPSIRIGIWGTVNAGKTIYLARLYDLLKESKNYNFQGTDQRAFDFAEQLVSDMNNETTDGTLPLPTLFLLGGTQSFDIFTYNFTYKNSQFGSIPITLEFIDAPGEFFEDTDRELTINHGEGAYNNVIDYLMSCHGVIFLLDYERSKPKTTKNDQRKPYFDLLSNLFSKFQLRSCDLNQVTDGYIQQYMAFCVTKADEDELWKKKDSMSLVKETMGEKMWRYLINNYSSVNTDLDAVKREQPRKDNRCNFYSTSAFGRYKNSEGKYVKVLKDPFVSSPNTSTPEQNTSNDWDWEEVINNNTPTNEPSSPKGGLDDIGEETPKEINIKARPTVIVEQGKPCNPSNILEPVEWLIRSIIQNPPKLPQPENKE